MAVKCKTQSLLPYNELIAFIKEEREYPFSKVNPTMVSVTPKRINESN